jgi:mxaA protein
MRRAALLTLALLMPTSAGAGDAAPPKTPVFQVRAQMRDTGYVLGDRLQQRIDIHVPDGAKLVAESVPRLGRVNNWLELREVRIEPHRDAYTLLMSYQMFGAVESAMQLAIPPFQLRFAEAAHPATPTAVMIEAKSFYQSPVLPATLGDADREPRATLRPQKIASARWPAIASASLAVALLLSLYLAWAYDRLPWSPGKPGPLSLLFRELRRRRASTPDASAYRDLLRKLHEALNRSAGQTLYLDNLPLLFARAPYLQPLQADFDSLFRHSRRVFYDAAADDIGHKDWPTSRVIELCRRARDCERGLQ